MLEFLLYIGGATLLATLLTRNYFKRKDNDYYVGKHVVITGGSEGMGFQLAKELFLMGAKVTIMARTKAKLEKAKSDILSLKKTSPLSIKDSASIEFVPCNVTDYKAVGETMKEAVKLQGGVPINTTIMSAGRSVPGYFLDQDPQVFMDQMNLNYMGCVNVSKVAAAMMIESGTKGHLVLVSSCAASASFTGYSSYAPTKSAVRGLADAMRNELRGFGIQVHIAYPPDTDTPGFEKENETKPKETLEISPPEVYSAHSVAMCMLDGILRGEYHLPSPDIVQNFLISSTVNITPRGRWAPVEIVLAPIIALAMLGFKFHADRVAVQYGKRVLQSMGVK
uniref:3-dehydrosphinganine reductase n=1 Tax=Mucochytrium quahogii TaxID=96639 RepID=A0A7S2WFY2_9STRA|mmetsp:Transcript_7686/g.12449  ORF Transcript_7686/g.12449 Transcript_7686/m.12449 type:complete len:337 (-) Transcript_7686:59-1069(-)